MQRQASKWVWFAHRGLFAMLCMLMLSYGLEAANESGPRLSNTAAVLTLHDAIGPATSDFFVRALDRANREGNALLIVELDTPGGLDTAMRDMIRAILASAVPVVTYVSPSGARAASAGTYLLYASHIAAMAPATNLGAATPISLIPAQTPSPDRPSSDKPSSDKPGSDKPSDDKKPPEPGSTEERKAINDAVAYIRGLAELRGRNAEWAESAVRAAQSLSATQALEQHAIDVIAKDLPDLLRQLDGRTIKTSQGELTLHTRNLQLQRIETDWRTQLLAVITNPNVAYLLMLIGIYGLMLEGFHPGAILPGVVGAISLLLALFAFQVLPVNYAGLALIALGVLLIAAEAFVPSFGSLGLGGVISFVIGSVILMKSNVPGLQIAWQLIGSIAFVAATLLLALILLLVRSRRRPAVTGADQMLAEPAYALNDFEAAGLVRVRGELWQAVSAVPVHAGQALRIVKVRGLTLEVAPLSPVTTSN